MTQLAVRLVIVFLAACCVAGSSVSAQQQKPQEEPQQSDTWTEIQKLYEKAKEAGEEVPAGIYEWFREDLQRVGDWEYHVVSLANGDAAQLEDTLNELGDERWECFWVQSESEDKTRFFFKRPKRSYLKAVPLSDLLRLLPHGE